MQKFCHNRSILLRFQDKRIFAFYKMAAKSGGENDFCEKLPIHFADTLWVINYVEIQDGHQKWRGKQFLRKVASTFCRYPVGHKLR